MSLPLSEAPEGESELVLTVRDEVSGRTLEAREPLRVEPPAAPSRPVEPSSGLAEPLPGWFTGDSANRILIV